MPLTEKLSWNVSHFTVEIDGLSASEFTSISGLWAQIAVTEMRDGGSQQVRKIPGEEQYGNISLTRALGADMSLWQWFNEVTSDALQRRNIAIFLLDGERNKVFTWRISNAWPYKYEGPNLNANSNDLAMESIEICHEGLVAEALPAT